METKEYRYHGNRHPFAVVLCHKADVERFAPVMEELQRRDLRLYLMTEDAISENLLRKACSVIAVMTGHFYGCEALSDVYIKAGALKKEVVSIRADGTAMPEVMANYTYSQNSINLSKYSPEEAAEKILTSNALKSPKLTAAQTAGYKRTIAALVCAALVFVCAVGFAAYSAANNGDKRKMSIVEQYGISQEELEKINSVVIMGDQLEYSKFDKSQRDYLDEAWENDSRIWIRKEDGTEVEMGGPQDLSFLTLMPNLSKLILVNQTATAFPDLSSLSNLHFVEIWNSGFENIEGLRGCSNLGEVTLSLNTVTDLSPLSGCPELRKLYLWSCEGIRSFEGLAAPQLQIVEVDSQTLGDFSALADCPELKKIALYCNGNSGLRDFSALSDCTGLLYVTIRTDYPVDLSFTATLPKLYELDINCRRVQNIDQIANHEYLTNFYLWTNDDVQELDLSSLGSLKGLSSLTLGNVSGSLAFLRELAREKNIFTRLEVSGPSMDWDGIEAFSRYSYLTLNTWGNDNTQLIDRLQETKVGELTFSNCGTIDVTKLSPGIDNLRLESCNVETLVGLPCVSLTGLTLENCGRLTSLSGLEENNRLNTLRVNHCIRLMDWSAIDGKAFQELSISHQTVLPDFGQLDFLTHGIIGLNNIYGLTELSCLDAIPDEIVQGRSLEVQVGGDELENLNALLRFKGKKLAVTPNLAQQGADLVNRGCFHEFRVNYPENNWQMEENEIELLSLDELDTLPKAALSRITSLTLAGDKLYDDSWGIEMRGREYAEGYDLFMCRWEQDVQELVDPAVEELDFSRLTQLTGLRRLRLVGQTIDSLDGIQELSELEELTIQDCEIEDISPIFALDSLRRLRLGGRNINSIQGIQNLYSLQELNLQSAALTDLSPLKELRLLPQTEEEGFDLCLPHTWMVSEFPEDLSVLESFSHYRCLSLNSYRQLEWTQYLEGARIEEGDFGSMFDDNEELEQFAERIGSAVKLFLGWNENVTDLRCLTQIEGLQVVEISDNMEEAAHSLDGVDYDFELVVRS